MIALDDNIEDHPKFVGLSNDAFALWVRCIGYCRRNLTDGFVPEAVAVARARSKSPQRPIAELLKVSPGCANAIWYRVPGGYQIHDYLEWNPSRADVEAKVEANREKGRRGGLRSGQVRSGARPVATKDEADGFADDEAQAKQPASSGLEPKRTPIRSDPVRSDPEEISTEKHHPQLPPAGASPGGGAPGLTQDKPEEARTPTPASGTAKARPGAGSLPGGGTSKGRDPRVAKLAEGLPALHPRFAEVASDPHGLAALLGVADGAGVSVEGILEAAARLATSVVPGWTDESVRNKLRGYVANHRRYGRSQRDEVPQGAEAPPRPKLPPGTGRDPGPMPLPPKAGPVEPSSNPVLRALGASPVPPRAAPGSLAPTTPPASAGAKAGAPTAVGDLLGGFVRGPSGEA